MKAKNLFLLAPLVIFWACTKTEVVAPTPIPVAPTPVVVNSSTGAVPVSIEVPPQDVHGADVTGKAQDMPEGTKEGEHNPNPIQATAVGETVPTPTKN